MIVEYVFLVTVAQTITPVESSALDGIIQWQNLLGFLTPLLVGILTKASWSGFVKRLIAVIFCVAVTVIGLIIQSKLDFTTVVAAFTTIGIIHQTSFGLLTKDFSLWLQDNVGATDPINLGKLTD